MILTLVLFFKGTQQPPVIFIHFSNKNQKLNKTTGKYKITEYTNKMRRSRVKRFCFKAVYRRIWLWIINLKKHSTISQDIQIFDISSLHSLFCRDFVYVAVNLIILPWFCFSCRDSYGPPYFTSSKLFIKHAVKYLIIKLFNLLNPLTKIKTPTNNLLMDFSFNKIGT